MLFLVVSDLASGVLGRRNISNRRAKCSSKPPAGGEPLSAPNGATGYYAPGKAHGGKWQKTRKASVQSCFDACAEQGCEAFVYSPGSGRCKMQRGSTASSAIKYCTDTSSKKNGRVFGIVSGSALQGVQAIESAGGSADVPSADVPSADVPSASTAYTMDDVAKHGVEGDCWVAANGNVYDISAFTRSHPGGRSILRECGSDATRVLNGKHSRSDRAYLDNTIGAIGLLEGGVAVPAGSDQGGFMDDEFDNDSDDDSDGDSDEDSDDELDSSDDDDD